MKDIDPKAPGSGQVASVDVVVSNGNENHPEENGDVEENERKITLTDHLNKKLLSSFLDRINQNPSIIPSECSRTEGSDDEFNDESDQKQENGH